MKVLYINGASDSGGVTTQQLAKIAPTLQISSVATVDEAVTEIRKGGWHGLLTPPTSAEHDTLTLIARLRQDRVPIAIVPIVTEWRQEFFSAAVAAGADDVLLVRGDTAVHAAETLSRIKQSPHLRPAEERRLRVLYVGKDPLVGSLLDQVPFVKAERATSVADGAIAGRTPAPGPDPLRADAVVIDDAPGESPSIAVLKFVRVHAPDLPIIVLTAPNAGEAAAGVLDLGVDDCILKSGIYRRRLIASLNRVHQRHDLVVQHTTLKARETRLRQIVENLPEGLAIVSADGTILAVNGAGLPLFGVARPGDVVGRDFYGFMAPERRDDVRALVTKVGAGQRGSLTVDLQAVDGVPRTLEIDGVMLERDARGARGVIAVLRPPRQANTDDVHIARANLAAVTEEAKERVTALTTELDKAKASHLAERSAWDAARAQLEERLQELITDADVRHGLDMRLATAETELHEVIAARKQFEAELDTSRAAVHEITASRDELAGRLDAARDELRHAVESHLSERTGWDTLRRTLETQIEESRGHGDARSDLERQLSAARSERSAVQADLDATRAELDGARDQVAAALHQFDAIRSERQRERTDFEHTIAEVTGDRDAMRREHDAVRAELGAVRSERDRLQADRDAIRTGHDAVHAERDTVRAERDGLRTERDGLRVELEAAQHALYRARDEHRSERESWDASRTQLESRFADAQVSAVARLEVEARLEAARTDMRQAADTFAAERAGWEATRRQLEARLHETQAAAGARSNLEAQIDAARSELRSLAEASSRDRAAWDGMRRTLHEQLEDAQRALSTDRHAWQADRAAWSSDREALERRLADSDSTEIERTRLEESLRTLQAQHAAYLEAQSVDRATRQRERAELDALRTAVDEERARRIKLDDELATARAEGSGRVTALEVEYTATRRALEAQIDDAEARTRRLAGESHAAHHELASHLSTMAASRDRLADSRLFGYALTTLEGRLLRCNDTFAQLFGYTDRQEALARSNGGAFPPIAGREGLDARLLAERAIPQVESCLERADGTPITVLESAAIVPTPADLTEAGGDRGDHRAARRRHERIVRARRPAAAGAPARGSRHARHRDGARHRRAHSGDRGNRRADLLGPVGQGRPAGAPRQDSHASHASRRARPSARGVQPPPGAGAATGGPQRGRRSRRADAHAAGRPARRFRNPPRQGRRRRCERGQSRAAAHDARGLGPRPAAGRRLARPRNDAPRLRAIRPGRRPGRAGRAAVGLRLRLRRSAGATGDRRGGRRATLRRRRAHDRRTRPPRRSAGLLHALRARAAGSSHRQEEPRPQRRLGRALERDTGLSHWAIGLLGY